MSQFNSFQTLNDYPVTLSGQLLKLCNEEENPEQRLRMARTVIKIWTQFYERPQNNNPTKSGEYSIDNCIWLTLPPR